MPIQMSVLYNLHVVYLQLLFLHLQEHWSSHAALMQINARCLIIGHCGREEDFERIKTFESVSGAGRPHSVDTLLPQHDSTARATFNSSDKEGDVTISKSWIIRKR